MVAVRVSGALGLGHGSDVVVFSDVYATRGDEGWADEEIEAERHAMALLGFCLRQIVLTNDNKMVSFHKGLL